MAEQGNPSKEVEVDILSTQLSGWRIRLEAGGPAASREPSKSRHPENAIGNIAQMFRKSWA